MAAAAAARWKIGGGVLNQVGKRVTSCSGSIICSSTNPAPSRRPTSQQHQPQLMMMISSPPPPSSLSKYNNNYSSISSSSFSSSSSSSSYSDDSVVSEAAAAAAALYEKNPPDEDEAPPTHVVPRDDGLIQPQSEDYWAPDPQTGVFSPPTPTPSGTDDLTSTSTSQEEEKNNEEEGSVVSVLDEQAIFRPTSLEDLEKPVDLLKVKPNPKDVDG